jgi:hypothetical protein
MNGACPRAHEVALGTGHDDHVDILGPQQLFRGDEFEVKIGHRFFLNPSPAFAGEG